MAVSFSDGLDGLRRVCDNQKYACIDTKSWVKQNARSLSCQLVPIPDAFNRESLAFIITKNSPYRGLINWR
jgi:hypothetical protein